MEADYIGLLLMASAGYDPRPVPKIYENIEKDANSRVLVSGHIVSAQPLFIGFTWLFLGGSSQFALFLSSLCPTICT
ncbi:mitochondrial metalloendopeptidase OMA1, partial [Trifolium pratense]